MFFDQYDVSPAGEHFVSCKEASLYLQSYFRDRDNQKIDQMAANVEQVGNVASETVSISMLKYFYLQFASCLI